jgi:hypothetical protein
MCQYQIFQSNTAQIEHGLCVDHRPGENLCGFLQQEEHGFQLRTFVQDSA